MLSNAAESQGRQINLLTTDIAPPHAVYLTADDSLQVNVLAQSGLSIQLTARILLADGSISANNWIVPVFGGGVASFSGFSLGEGYLLGVTLGSVGTIIRHGQIYALISLVRGKPALGNASQTLAFGYVTTLSPVFWPDMASEQPTAGIGNIRSITGTLPAAGAEINEAVPSFGVMWRLLAIRFGFTTSATVANRSTQLSFDDGVNVFAQVISPATLAASATRTCNYFQGANFNAGGFAIDSAPLPLNMELSPGFRIRTITFNLQPGDQYTAPQYLVEEWQQE